MLLALLLALATLPMVALAIPNNPGGPGGTVPDPGCASNDDCDDGNPCNGVERCVGIGSAPARCLLGFAPRCTDGDECTIDSCDPAVGCVHEPDPVCTAPTTSTTDVPSTSTTTTTRTSTSSTTTTRPPGAPEAECLPGTADCDDGDPCTRDDCNTDGTCSAVPLTGIAGVTCTCERTLPAACASTLPTRVGKLVDRACLAVGLAANEEGARQRRLLGGAKRSFGGAAKRSARFAKKNAIPQACASELGAQLSDAKARAEAARNAQ
jgi:hypothetical protein